MSIAELSASTGLAPARRRRTKWIIGCGAAVADQAVASGTTLALSLLLARELDAPAFGGFAIGVTVLLLASALHSALVLEPMAVLGPGRYATNLNGYLRAQIPLHFAVTVPPAALLVAAGAAVALTGRRMLAESLIGAGVALPFLLLQWLARSRRYVLGEPAGSLAGTAAGMLVVLVTASAAMAAGWRSPLAGLTALAAGSGVGAWLSLRRGVRAPPLPWRAVAREHWRYGRLMVPAWGVSVAGSQVQLLLVAGVVGLAGAAELRAMQIVALPASQFVVAISSLVLPSLARDFGHGSIERLRSRSRAVGAALLAGAVAYELLLVAFHRPIEAILYDGRFTDHARLIPVLGLVAVLQALTSGWLLALRAVQRPGHYLITGATMAVIGVGSAALLAPRWGVPGGAWSLPITYGVTSVVIFALHRAWVVRRP